MKYTNYLLKEQFIHIEYLETDKIYLKPIAIFIGIPVTIGGFALIGGLLPIAVFFDGYRSIKYWILKNDLTGSRRSYDLPLGNSRYLKNFWRSEIALNRPNLRKLKKFLN